MGLADTSVVVTGAASGIGYATAQRFADLGARVTSVDRREPVGPAGTRRLVVDVTDENAVTQAMATSCAEHGGVDVLVCCAGIDRVGAIDETSIEEWMRLYDVNVLGPVRTIRAGLPHLRASAQPCIVLVASAVASIGLRNRAAYTATKGALVAITRALAAELAVDGIRVISVSPGTVATPLLQVVADATAGESTDLADFLADAAARQPLGRIGSAAEIARTIAFVADPDSGQYTGADLLLDGGMTAIYAPVKAPAARTTEVGR